MNDAITLTPPTLTSPTLTSPTLPHPTLTYPTLPVRLRLLRETLCLSREQLAGCLTRRSPGNNVGRIERGAHNPSARTLARLAQGLGVSASFLAHGYRNETGMSPMGWAVDEAFPARLRLVLRQQGLMLDDLAAKMALSVNTLRPFARGAVRPRPETVVNIAKALGVSAKLLATGVAHSVPVENLTPGQRIMLVRHAAQLSRTELANEAQIPASGSRTGWQKVSVWESGKLRPSFNEFEKVAGALGVSIEFLMTGNAGAASDSLAVREGRLSRPEQKVLEDFRFMFETGALGAQEAAEFSRYLRKQLMDRIKEAA